MSPSRSPLTLIATVTSLTCLLLITNPANAEEDPLLVASRDTTAQFASRLQSALQEAMASGGPVAAITVCKDVAPQIASELSRQTGAKVSRTSLKYRNPGSAPESWQMDILGKFEGPDAPKEHFEKTGNNGARYMKAIPTGAPCLTCHGSELPEAVLKQLDEDYPHDRARGYELGDIRGAFSITWPDLANEPPATE